MFTCRDIALTMTHLMEGERSELATISPTSDGVYGEINPKKPENQKFQFPKIGDNLLMFTCWDLALTVTHLLGAERSELKIHIWFCQRPMNALLSSCTSRRPMNALK